MFPVPKSKAIHDADIEQGIHIQNISIYCCIMCVCIWSIHTSSPSLSCSQSLTEPLAWIFGGTVDAHIFIITQFPKQNPHTHTQRILYTLTSIQTHHTHLTNSGSSGAPRDDAACRLPELLFARRKILLRLCACSARRPPIEPNVICVLYIEHGTWGGVGGACIDWYDRSEPNSRPTTRSTHEIHTEKAHAQRRRQASTLSRNMLQFLGSCVLRMPKMWTFWRPCAVHRTRRCGSGVGGIVSFNFVLLCIYYTWYIWVLFLVKLYAQTFIQTMKNRTTRNRKEKILWICSRKYTTQNNAYPNQIAGVPVPSRQSTE